MQWENEVTCYQSIRPSETILAYIERVPRDLLPIEAVKRSIPLGSLATSNRYSTSRLNCGRQYLYTLAIHIYVDRVCGGLVLYRQGATKEIVSAGYLRQDEARAHPHDRKSD